MEIKTEPKVKKHRARRAKTTAVNPAASLLAALKFVAVARRSFAFDRREVDVKVDFWKKNQGYITHSIFELEE